ncbi:MAG TPA: LuxR C-terminal-related transcriptional regulator [Terriglobales bacterium]|nr:LuxR C-terminal-related transcriptional regulator [Terriglobales bacterium]
MMSTTALSPGFSRREKQIVGGLLEAKAVKDIALDLDLSVNTVKDYLKTIYRKAQVHSARELMVKLERPGAALPDIALAELLQAAQGLEMPAALPQQALARLGPAVRRCTRAQRVDFWRLVPGPLEPFLSNDAGLGTLRIGGFIQRVLDRGWARMEADEARGAEGRQCAALGYSGDLLGVRCAPALRVHLMLLGNPLEGSFGALDLATARLLARLTASGSSDRRQALSATA